MTARKEAETDGNGRSERVSLHRYLVQEVLGRHNVSIKSLCRDLGITDKTLRKRNDKASSSHVQAVIAVVKARYSTYWNDEVGKEIERAAEAQRGEDHVSDEIGQMPVDVDTLTPEARQLHSLLMDIGRPIVPDALLRAVAGKRPQCVKGYLLWRYAVRAGGNHSPFGAPAQLEHHFVKLLLDPVSIAADEIRRNDREHSRLRNRDVTEAATLPTDEGGGFEFHDLLQGDRHKDVEGWLITADPLAGKTTLLAAWELRTALDALRRNYVGKPWGEVCIFLPMRGYAARVREYLAQGASWNSLFPIFVSDHAPGLPSISASDRSKPRGRSSDLKFRLLLDGLNEMTSSSIAERSHLVREVCNWLALPKANDMQLPPVFSVRERENGLALTASRDSLNPHWTVRAARLRAWGRSEMRRYLDVRGLPFEARVRFERALGLDSAEHIPLTPLASFCSAPGILAAQCTLLQRWPHMAPPQGRGPLFLALLWHKLMIHVDDLPIGDVGERLVPESMFQEFVRVVKEGRWSMPPEAGVLVKELAAQADAMHDSAGGSCEHMPISQVPPGLLKPEDEQVRRAWLQAVRAMGLAWWDLRAFGYTHQQWREFFGALHLNLSAIPLVLTPPALDPLNEVELPLRLPTITAHQERVRFAGSLSDNVVGWIMRVLPENLALAAQLAIDNRELLEGDASNVLPKWPHPVLQHLRRELLLCSVDAGHKVKERLRAAGVIAALDEMQSLLQGELPKELNARWRDELYGIQGERAFQGDGVDIRLRLEAGLLLGRLGNTLQYEAVERIVSPSWHPEGAIRYLRLKDRHWLDIGVAGTTTEHTIGNRGGRDEEAPEWRVNLGHFQIAAYPVTVAEYRCFVIANGYDADQPWWGGTEASAYRWLQFSKRRTPSGWGFDDNSTLPVVGVTWWESKAFARWLTALDSGNGRHMCIDLPTEVHWEAAARAGSRSELPESFTNMNITRSPTLDFNSGDLKFGRSPAGVFSRSLSGLGGADFLGNVWEWCDNAAVIRSYVSEEGRTEACRPAVDSHSPRALRGGSFSSRGYERVSCRNYNNPDLDNWGSGFRLIRRRILPSN